jgi:hypothetical protein
MVTGITAGLIRVTIPRIGGAYGGKITRSLMVSSAVALAAQLTGAPVRCVVRVCCFSPLYYVEWRHVFIACPALLLTGAAIFGNKHDHGWQAQPVHVSLLRWIR